MDGTQQTIGLLKAPGGAGRQGLVGGLDGVDEVRASPDRVRAVEANTKAP